MEFRTTTRQAADAIAPIACRGFAERRYGASRKGRDRAYRVPILVLFDDVDLRPIRKRITSLAGTPDAVRRSIAGCSHGDHPADPLWPRASMTTKAQGLARARPPSGLAAARNWARTGSSGSAAVASVFPGPGVKRDFPLCFGGSTALKPTPDSPESQMPTAVVPWFLPPNRSGWTP